MCGDGEFEEAVGVIAGAMEVDASKDVQCFGGSIGQAKFTTWRKWAYDTCIEHFLRLKKPKGSSDEAALAFNKQLEVFVPLLVHGFEKDINAYRTLTDPATATLQELQRAVPFTLPESTSKDKNWKTFAAVEPYKSMVSKVGRLMKTLERKDMAESESKSCVESLDRMASQVDFVDIGDLHAEVNRVVMKIDLHVEYVAQHPLEK